MGIREMTLDDIENPSYKLICFKARPPTCLKKINSLDSITERITYLDCYFCGAMKVGWMNEWTTMEEEGRESHRAIKRPSCRLLLWDCPTTYPSNVTMCVSMWPLKLQRNPTVQVLTWKQNDACCYSILCLTAGTLYVFWCCLVLLFPSVVCCYLVTQWEINKKNQINFVGLFALPKLC